MDEIKRRTCNKCGQLKIVVLDFLIVDRDREDSMCKKCRTRKYRDNYIPKSLRGQFGVKL